MNRKKVTDELEAQRMRLDHMDAVINSMSKETLDLLDRINTSSNDFKFIVGSDYPRFKKFKESFEKDLGRTLEYRIMWTSGNFVLFSWEITGMPYIDVWYECHYSQAPKELATDCEIKEVTESSTHIAIVCNKEDM